MDERQMTRAEWEAERDAEKTHAVPAPVPPVEKVVAPVAQPAPPTHTVTNQNVVINRGGQAGGKLVTFKRRMGGRNVQSITVSVGTTNGGGMQSHHPIYVDAAGVEHISVDGRTLRKLSDLKHLHIVRREHVNRG